MRVGPRWLLLLVTLVVGLSSCRSGEVDPPLIEEADIYADLATRLCAQARCGPSHPAFVLLEGPSDEGQAAVKHALPDALFISSTAALIGPDGRVIDGGRILHIGSVQPGPRDEVVLIDTYWESSRTEGKGETYVYEWNGDIWVFAEPSTVGVPVTTAVP
ncbi:MAG: hypothetical protein ACR2OI_12430 [Acidimicrobiia bacterium]